MTRKASPDPMRLHRVSLAGLGPFSDPVDLDLDGLPGPLVACCGDVGEGKSTLLELAFPGVLYRETPTRGSLSSLLTAREGYVEATITHGGRWTIRHTVRKVGRKTAGESVVLDEKGKPAYEGTSLPAFDAWSAAHLPAPEVFYASTFTRQSRPEVDLTKAATLVEKGETARKSAMLRALAIEIYEKHRGAARARKTIADESAAKLEERIADERARAGITVEAAEEAVTAARVRAAGAAAELMTAREEAVATAAARIAHAAAVAAATAARVQHDALEERSGEARARRDELLRRLEAARALLAYADEIGVAATRIAAIEEEIAALAAAEDAASRAAVGAEHEAGIAELRARAATDRAEAAARHVAAGRVELRRRIEGARARLAEREGRAHAAEEALWRAPAIRAAVARDAALIPEIGALDEAATATREERQAASGRAGGARAAEAEATRRLAEAQRRGAIASRRLVDAAFVDEAVVALPAAEAAAAEAGEAHWLATAAAEEARIAAGAALEGRHAALLGFVRAVAAGLPDPRGVAREAIAADERAALASTGPGRAAVAAALSQAAEALAAARDRVGALRLLAARSEEVAAAREEAAAAEEAAREAGAVVATERIRAAEAEEAGRGCDGRAEEIRQTRALLAFERNALAGLVAAAPSLDTAAAQLAEAARAAAEIGEELAETEWALGALPVDDGPEAAGARREAVEAAAARDEARSRATFHTDAARASGAARAALLHERTGLATIATHAAAIAPAEEQIRALTPEIAAAEETVAALAAELGAVEIPAVPPAPPADDGAAVAAAEEAVRVAEAAAGRADEGLRHARASAARIEVLEHERAAALEQADDAAAAAQGIGFVIADSVDAAGPRLTRDVNFLLHTCLSPRWTVEVQTMRPGSEKGKLVECCDFFVLDTFKDRRAPIETFSGGEAQLIGEAIALAFTMLATSSGGAPTIVRDEASTHLDAKWSRAWVEMLRLAAREVNASKVIFVSHATDGGALADCRIVVKGGRVEVEM